MFPDQQNNNGGVNSAPQQGPSGQYQVVPPLPVSNNVGHSGHNPYEFIVNPNTPKHNRSLFGGGSSVFARLGILLGGAVLLMIIVGIVISALAPKGSTSGLTAIAQRQQEIVRVATAATLQATGQDTKNFVANTELSITSSQQQVLAYLADHGTKLAAKQLGLDKDAQTDTLLANAATANNYDSAAVENLTSQLQTYKQQLQTTFNQTSSKTVKQLVQNSFASADKLLAQAKAISASN